LNVFQAEKKPVSLSKRQMFKRSKSFALQLVKSAKFTVLQQIARSTSVDSVQFREMDFVFIINTINYSADQQG
jgi:hypothetical protein